MADEGEALQSTTLRRTSDGLSGEASGVNSLSPSIMTAGPLIVHRMRSYPAARKLFAIRVMFACVIMAGRRDIGQVASTSLSTRSIIV